MKCWRIVAAVAVLTLLGTFGMALAELDLSRTQNWVIGLGEVDGAPLKVYRDQTRRTNCYFWKQSLSCVKE
jgi:hypothetical protein